MNKINSLKNSFSSLSKGQRSKIITDFFIAILFILCIACNKKNNKEIHYSYFNSLSDSVFYFPGEFEPQYSVWMSWSKYENKKGLNVKKTQAEIISALSENLKVNLLAKPNDNDSTKIDSTIEKEIIDYLYQAKAKIENVNIIPLQYEDIWMRDMGPIFVKNKKGQKAIIDFKFNVWGYENEFSPLSQIEGSVDKKIAHKLNLPLITSSLISEGGAKEFNGKGTLILVESVEKHRNPNLTKKQIETEYKRIFGVKKIIWLPFGLYDDELSFKRLLPGPDGKLNAYTVITTGGHIDQIVRFVSPNKILYAYCLDEEELKDPIIAENKKRMDINLQILKNETDQDGHPFELIPMPFAPTIYDTLKPGDGVYNYLVENDSMKAYNPIKSKEPITVVLATGYLNFLISNNVVIQSKYWRKGDPLKWKKLDSISEFTLKKVFPERKIILIDARSINIGGGGIHCITQQEPQ